jgi:hypothetical protein
MLRANCEAPLMIGKYGFSMATTPIISPSILHRLHMRRRSRSSLYRSTARPPSPRSHRVRRISPVAFES